MLGIHVHIDYYSTFLVLAGVICLSVALYIWRTRLKIAGARALIALLLGMTFWDLAYAMFWAGVPEPIPYFWLDIMYVGAGMVPTAFFVFACQIAQADGWLNRRTLAMLLLEPLLVVLVIYTDPWHHLFYGVDRSKDIALLIGTGPLYWLNVAYTFGLILVAVGLLLRQYRKRKGLYRRQIGTILVAVGLVWLNSIIFLAGFSPLPDADSTPFFFSIAALISAHALVYYRLLDVVPVARDLLVERMQDGWIVLDAQNRLLDINPAAERAIGLAGRWQIGQLLQRDLFPFPLVVDEFLPVTETRTEIDMGPDRAEGRRYMDLQISPLLDAQDRFVGRLVVWRDITVRKQLEIGLEAKVAQRTAALAAANEHLQELDRLKDDFIARIGHELRTPLTNIQLYLHLLGKARPEKIPMYLQTLGSEANQLQRLIEDLLNIFQLSTEETQIALMPVHVNTVVAELVESRVQMAGANSIELQTQMDANLPPALADEAMLREVLNHLMDNAMSYAPHGTITLRTCVDQYMDQPWVCIQVQDTGPGVAENERAYLFDRFYRGQAASSYEIPGAGLGLSICRVLMQRMGGEITLDEATTPGAVLTARLRPAAATPPLAIRPTRIRS